MTGRRFVPLFFFVFLSAYLSLSLLSYGVLPITHNHTHTHTNLFLSWLCQFGPVIRTYSICPFWKEKKTPPIAARKGLPPPVPVAAPWVQRISEMLPVYTPESASPTTLRRFFFSFFFLYPPQPHGPLRRLQGAEDFRDRGLLVLVGFFFFLIAFFMSLLACCLLLTGHWLHVWARQ